MKLTVKVTEADIAQGRPGDSTSCPIALALRRGLDPLINVCVVRHSVVFQLPDAVCACRVNHPPEAIDFVKAFDTSCFPKLLLAPQTFTFEVPDSIYKYYENQKRHNDTTHQ